MITVPYKGDIVKQLKFAFSSHFHTTTHAQLFPNLALPSPYSCPSPTLFWKIFFPIKMRLSHSVPPQACPLFFKMIASHSGTFIYSSALLGTACPLLATSRHCPLG